MSVQQPSWQEDMMSVLMIVGWTFHSSLWYLIRSRIITTGRQKAAVHFCEQWLNITFNGDINNFQQVSNFLSEYLEEAKNLYEEVKCEYEAYLWDLMD